MDDEEDEEEDGDMDDSEAKLKPESPDVDIKPSNLPASTTVPPVSFFTLAIHSSDSFSALL